MKEIRCSICGKFPEQKITKDEQILEIYFVDPKTKETLCAEHNKINNQIYRDKGKFIIGELKIKNETKRILDNE